MSNWNETIQSDAFKALSRTPAMTEPETLAARLLAYADGNSLVIPAAARLLLLQAAAALTAPDRVGQVVAWLRKSAETSGRDHNLSGAQALRWASMIEAGEHGGSHAGE